MESKSGSGRSTQAPQAIPGPLHVMHRLDSDEGNESKVGPKARTLASLHPVDSDPGPHRMPLMDLKSAPRPGLEIQWIPSIQTLVLI